MDIQTFIQNFREAFGKNAELPLVFWYSDEQKGETEKINGCFFKGMRTVRDGGIISLKPKTSVVAAVNSILASPKCQNVYQLSFRSKRNTNRLLKWSSTLYSKSEFPEQKTSIFILHV